MAITVTTGGPIGSSGGGGAASGKSLLTIMKEVCPKIGLAVPDAVFTSGRREHIELQATANEAAQSIVEARDWQALSLVATLMGDGTSESFPLPSDYQRMTKRAQLWSTALPLQPLIQYNDTDDWLADTPFAANPWGAWVIMGGQVHIRPVLPSDVAVKFNYISSYYALDASGNTKPAFTADLDTFVLDPRLLRLAIIWQWKAAKGFPYAEDMATFEMALASLGRSDRGAPPVVGERTSNIPSARAAFPGMVSG